MGYFSPRTARPQNHTRTNVVLVWSSEYIIGSLTKFAHYAPHVSSLSAAYQKYFVLAYFKYNVWLLKEAIIIQSQRHQPFFVFEVDGDICGMVNYESHSCPFSKTNVHQCRTRGKMRKYNRIIRNKFWKPFKLIDKKYPYHQSRPPPPEILNTLLQLLTLCWIIDISFQ